MSTANNDLLEQLLKAIQNAADQDWFMAVYLHALDRTKDAKRAIRIANEAMRKADLYDGRKSYEAKGWVTVGGTSCKEGEHCGGSHVDIDGKGKIKKGPKELVGEKLANKKNKLEAPIIEGSPFKGGRNTESAIEHKSPSGWGSFGGDENPEAVPSKTDEDPIGAKKEEEQNVEADKKAEEDWKKNGVRSQSFKSWFGDWENDPSTSSKVVKANGEPQETSEISGSGKELKEGKAPQRVYHGTPTGGFNQFSLQKAGSNVDAGFLGQGFYFTDDPKVAEYYAKVGSGKNSTVIPAYLSIKSPFQWGSKTLGSRGLVLRGELLPKEIHDKVIARTGFKYDSDAETDFNDEKLLSEAIRDELISQGYDGVIAETSNGSKEYVAFDPAQVKSIHNRGTFDFGEANFTKSLSVQQKCMEGPNKGKPGVCPEATGIHHPKTERMNQSRVRTSILNETHKPKSTKPIPSYSTPSDSSRQKLAKTPVRSATQLKGGHKNEAFLMELNDGTKIVFKPAAGEQWLASGIEEGMLFRREVATSLTAGVLGFGDLVPLTTFSEQEGSEGSIQLYVDEAIPAVKASLAERYDGEEDASRAAALDYICGQLDRHQGNWLVKNGKLVLIDNGTSFSSSEEDIPWKHNMEFWRNAVDNGLPIPDLSSIKGKWGELEKTLKKSGIEEEAIALAKKRFDAITSGKHKTLATLPGFAGTPTLKETIETSKDWRDIANAQS